MVSQCQSSCATLNIGYSLVPLCDAAKSVGELLPERSRAPPTWEDQLDTARS